MSTADTCICCRRSIFPRKLLLYAAVSAVLFLSGTTTSTRAFSPEIFNQVIVQLGSLSQLGVDELAFAAANLLDGGSMTQKQRSIPLLPPRNSGRIIIPVGLLPQLPQLAPSVYDDTQAVQGLLDLTPQEEELIQLICEVRNKYSPRTTIRIAGGWVRDKLIYGKETPSRDVDLVLSDTSGKEFAEKVRKYLEETKHDYGEDNDDAKDAIRIQQQKSSNSKGDQTNHLQNESLLISGFDVDFCQMRYEKYKDKDSRIPTKIGVASAAEDAWRRDLTINALYYNINTNQVEDWTERGITDLLSQTIDTPKKPLPTLLEDPTRILRAIRFAAQLSFDMSPALIRAARDDRVRYALQYKVSRDSIGKAIDEMLGTRARDPCRGIQLLVATELVDVVFPLGEQADAVDSMTIYKAGLQYLSRTQSLVTRVFLQSPDLEWDISKRRLLWYAAFFKPVYEMSTRSSGKTKRSKRQASAFYQLLDALKRPKADVQSIESILKGVKPLQNMIDENGYVMQSAINSGACLTDESPRNSEWKELSELRWILYSAFNPIGTMWKEALILALASSQKGMFECAKQYNELVSFIENNLQLGDILNDKDKPRPLMNGSQIQEALQGQIDGKGFRHVVQAIEEWQIRNVVIDLDSIDDETRKKMEAQLVEYLVTTFPEYANSTNECR